MSEVLQPESESHALPFKLIKALQNFIHEQVLFC